MGITQRESEWKCDICGEIFGRVENAIVHDFKKHQPSPLRQIR